MSPSQIKRGKGSTKTFPNCEMFSAHVWGSVHVCSRHLFLYHHIHCHIDIIRRSVILERPVCYHMYHCITINLYTLSETNSSHLKMDGWKTIRLPFGKNLFSGVSFREGILSWEGFRESPQSWGILTIFAQLFIST